MIEKFNNIPKEGKIFIAGFLLFMLLSYMVGAEKRAKKKQQYQRQKAMYNYSSNYIASYNSGRDHYVSPYTRSDGSYVPGHRRTNSDHYKHNNYSSSGNVNPYTGKKGNN